MVTEESPKETVKTIARGMPGEPGEPVVTTLVCSFYFACEAAGASRARHSLRPLSRGQDVSFKTRVECAARSRTHVIARSPCDEAIHSSSFRGDAKHRTRNPRDSPMRNCASEVWSFVPSRNDKRMDC